MRKERLAFVLLALVCSRLGAQQAAPSPQPDEKTAASVQYKPAAPPPKGTIWSCPAQFDFHPEVDGIYKVGGDVKPPKVTNNVEAEFSDEARHESSKNPNFQATSVLYLVVDTAGKPQDICIQTLAGHGLDSQAVKAARQYRFHPGTKAGVPVAVRIKLDVTFRRY
jgi:hypothetical protein